MFPRTMSADVTSVYRFDDIESLLTAANSRRQLLAGQDFSTALSSKLAAMLPEEDGILSLDIFDTFLLRDNSSEITRFVEIGGLMADIANAAADATEKESGRKPRDVSAIDAFLARYLGTRASYKASKPVKGCREGSLSEIHATASRLLTGSARLSEAFIEAELAYEATRMKPNRLLLDIAKQHRNSKGRVVLLTDMYMHASQVETLLDKLGVDRSLFDLIVSSADTKVSKASGGVFMIVEKALKAMPAQFVHLGDSLKGDFQKPVEHGWRAIHLPIPEAEIVMRRKDHLKTASMLAKTHGLSVDIAMPR